MKVPTTMSAGYIEFSVHWLTTVNCYSCQYPQMPLILPGWFVFIATGFFLRWLSAIPKFPRQHFVAYALASDLRLEVHCGKIHWGGYSSQIWCALPGSHCCVRCFKEQPQYFVIGGGSCDRSGSFSVVRREWLAEGLIIRPSTWWLLSFTRKGEWSMEWRVGLIDLFLGDSEIDRDVKSSEEVKGPTSWGTDRTWVI